MAIQIQLRKGTATEHNTFTGASGEVTVDTTNKTLRVHDGSTVGGIRLATITGGLIPASQLPVATTSVQGAVILNNSLTSTNTNQALTAAQGKVLNDQAFGVGQTWLDVTAWRTTNVFYTNSTGKPIQVSVVVRDSSGDDGLFFFVNGAVVVVMPDIAGGSSGFQQLTITVPPMQTYGLQTANLLQSWAELR